MNDKLRDQLTRLADEWATDLAEDEQSEKVSRDVISIQRIHIEQLRAIAKISDDGRPVVDEQWLVEVLYEEGCASTEAAILGAARRIAKRLNNPPTARPEVGKPESEAAKRQRREYMDSQEGLQYRQTAALEKLFDLRSAGDVDADQAKAEGDAEDLSAFAAASKIMAIAADVDLFLQVNAMKWRAIYAHKLCFQAMKQNPSVATLQDDGALHRAIHSIVAVDTPSCSQTAPKPAGCEASWWLDANSETVISSSRKSVLTNTYEDWNIPLYTQPQAVEITDAMVDRALNEYRPMRAAYYPQQEMKAALLAALAPGGEGNTK